MAASNLQVNLPANTNEQDVYGENNEFIKIVSRRTGVKINESGPQLSISGGTAAKRRKARDILQEMAQLSRTTRLNENVVEQLLDGELGQEAPAAPEQSKQTANDNVTAAFKDVALPMRGKGTVVPRNESGAEYLRAIFNNEVVFGIGPAGTGKTYLAVAAAVHAFDNDPGIKKIILCRPAVEAGEKLGFLPGDMKDKVDPYMQPLYDALAEMKDAHNIKNLIDNGSIEIAPLAFMRGRTLKNAIVVLDEAQNTTHEQMKMFLTRMGENSRLIITGDISQIDLPAETESGLKIAIETMTDVDGLAIHEFTTTDVVRHEMVGRMINAYEKNGL